jgi:hypothetical protein
MDRQQKARESVHLAADYLNDCGIHVPPFRLSVERKRRFGGSFVDFNGSVPTLNIGSFPSSFLRNWVAIHEIGHLLWNYYRPLRWKPFRTEFSAPRPNDYQAVYEKVAWITPTSHAVGWLAGPQRPAGEPSWYGAKAGGEERFCEMIALIYAHGDFSKPPPPDLAGLWNCCWTHALARMT